MKFLTSFKFNKAQINQKPIVFTDNEQAAFLLQTEKLPKSYEKYFVFMNHDSNELYFTKEWDDVPAQSDKQYVLYGCILTHNTFLTDLKETQPKEILLILDELVTFAQYKEIIKRKGLI